jgi:hypothetical protein
MARGTLSFPGGSGARFPDDGGNHVRGVIQERLCEAFGGPPMPARLTNQFSAAMGLMGCGWQAGDLADARGEGMLAQVIQDASDLGGGFVPGGGNAVNSPLWCS